MHLRRGVYFVQLQMGRTFLQHLSAINARAGLKRTNMDMRVRSGSGLSMLLVQIVQQDLICIGRWSLEKVLARWW